MFQADRAATHPPFGQLLPQENGKGKKSYLATKFEWLADSDRLD